MGNDKRKKNNLRVCIVEDEKMILETYQVKLEKEGYEVFIAENGVEGYEIIKDAKPDIALIDMMMPNKSGIDLIKQLRKDSEFSNLPIIIVTNVDEQKMIEKTYDLDVSFYLTKAKYEPSDVARIVREVLSSKHITPD